MKASTKRNKESSQGRRKMIQFGNTEMQHGLKNTKEGKCVSRYNKYWSYKIMFIITYCILNIFRTKTGKTECRRKQMS